MEQELRPGLLKWTLREGAAGEAVAPGATVRLRYTVSNASDLASERLRLVDEWHAQPTHVFSVELGQGDALPCVETAVLSMTQGELACFVLSDSAAVELQQMVPSLSAAESLALTIELCAVVAAPKLDPQIAMAHKQAGNDAFKAKDYTRALEEYMRAIDVVDQLQHQTSPSASDLVVRDADAAAELVTLQLDAHNNIALCNIHTSSFAAALHHCNIVLTIDSANAKALNRRARAYKGLHDYGSARHDCEAILRLVEEQEDGGAVTARMAQDAAALLAASGPIAHSYLREIARKMQQLSD